MATIRTIAEESGVSISAVSRILNGKEVRVSEETRLKVMEVAARHHYKANHAASTLKTSRTGMIAIIIPFAHIDFFSQFLFHLEASCQEAGYIPLVINTNDDIELETKALELAMAGVVDGLIISPQSSHINNDTFREISRSGIPMVFADRRIPGLGIASVTTDNYHAGYEATRRLTAAGCRNLLFLYRAGMPESSILTDRRDGFSAAVFDDDDEETSGRVAAFPYHRAVEGITRILKENPGVDGIFSLSTADLVHVYRACRKAEVPAGRLVFAGFDEFSIPFQELREHSSLDYLNRPHFIVRQNVKEMATRSVRCLVSAIRGGEPGTDTLLDFEIIPDEPERRII